ncbi:hypothetical protein ACEP1N_32935 [Pseudomonas aeruginosa]|uniref:hypothetical protein n=3 Tax=Pseudomonas aeruginosa TaxID=287 RepID=UPI00072AB5F4|nr:hypothetical protein [Pseudomonas aeruginosa]KSM17188.1 hypothetical protein APA61_17225 [Pseudomonas aeruginosa]OTF38919.1 hypothetical protein B1R29_25005 [Pseudomonas aeruginosa]PTZ37947.1 hypothetical protein DB381_32780 [Pseudomonas aeruginosa]
MAALNVTQPGMTTGVQLLGSASQSLLQLEKISCWRGRFFQVDPLFLFGKRIRAGVLVESCYDDDRDIVDESIVIEAKVIAVQIGSASDGIETSLLLKEDLYEPEFVDVGCLTVLEVLE